MHTRLNLAEKPETAPLSPLPYHLATLEVLDATDHARRIPLQRHLGPTQIRQLVKKKKRTPTRHAANAAFRPPSPALSLRRAPLTVLSCSTPPSRRTVKRCATEAPKPSGTSEMRVFRPVKPRPS